MENGKDPTYRIEFRIVDTNNGFVAIKGSTYLPNKSTESEEVAETEFWSVLNGFRNKIQKNYEEINYSLDQQNDEDER
jgi:hypothetical protein